jgi:class 3 adenylate cyclase
LVNAFEFMSALSCEVVVTAKRRLDDRWGHHARHSAPDIGCAAQPRPLSGTRIQVPTERGSLRGAPAVERLSSAPWWGGPDVLIGELPSGTATFLFTDIEGSTPLWDEHPAAMREALALHDEILRKQIDRCGGHIFSTGGDGVAAVFGRATDGVTAAISAQTSLLDVAWPEPIELRVRMGLHTGEVQERDGDYLGPAVNRAARLMDDANGGQVIVSGVTASLVDSTDEFGLADLADAPG